jgi:adenosyl cobinamide kinase/adenosyl cobinamide phosphate guanylyltransferase
MSADAFNRQKKPEPTQADLALQNAVRQRIGKKRTGRVVVISREVGTGYVQEDQTGVYFSFARKFLPAFDALKEGMAVEFYENGHNAVAELRTT